MSNFATDDADDTSVAYTTVRCGVDFLRLQLMFVAATQGAAVEKSVGGPVTSCWWFVSFNQSSLPWVITYE
jgi:hypothetical protein